MTRSSVWGAKPTETHHDGYDMIEPVRDLAERAVMAGSAKDVERLMAKADSQLAELKQEFPIWMASELADLEKVFDLYKSGTADAATLLFRKAHDMRGQAATFGYPLAGRAADCLCKLMDALQRVPDDVIEAHMQAIRVIIRQNVNVEDHPLGVQMIRGLENLGHGLIKKALAT